MLFYLNPFLLGSQVVVKYLEYYNINTVFGYAGGTNLPLLNQLYNHSYFQVYTNRHEQSSGFSAIGYSKSSSKIPLLLTTSGPGLTNVITPLQDALNDGVSLLCISGQVSNTDLGTKSFQEVNAIGLTKYCTKWNYQIQTIKELEFGLQMAFYHLFSTQERKGPIHLDICTNVWKDTIQWKNEYKKKDFTFLPRISSSRIKWNTENSTVSNISTIALQLNKAQKPIIIVGQGNNQNYLELRRLSKLFQIPVTTTLHGVGNINEKENLALKMMGMHGTVYANKLVQEADFILGIGNRFDDRILGNKNSFGHNAKKKFGIYHINNNPECLRIASELIQSKGLFTNTSSFYRQIFPLLRKKNRKEWLTQIKMYKDKYALQYPDDSFLRMEDILLEWNHRLKKDFFITTGVGTHQMKVAQYIHWTKPNQLLTSGSLGTMGVGLGYAIGASIANPNHTVYLMDGDGSFMMSLQELGTIQEYNLPIKICLFNNEELNMISNWQDFYYNQRYIGNKIVNPNYKWIAEAYKIPYYYCSQKKDIKNAINFLYRHSYAMVEFKVKSEQCYPFVPPKTDLDKVIYYEQPYKINYDFL
jgi:acetolactate synthase-1/2/3 large subunit